MTYLITYDLFTPGKNYEPLITAIMQYGSWAKLGYSCWAVRSDLTAVQIRDELAPLLDTNDRLFVCAFTNWASFHFSEDVLHWLNN